LSLSRIVSRIIPVLFLSLSPGALAPVTQMLVARCATVPASGSAPWPAANNSIPESLEIERLIAAA
jgi:hypothetical protein